MGLQQKQSSKAEQVGVSFIKNKFPLKKPFSEQYVKKLIGKNDVEDSLKRLDKLTQEEARMAAAQLLKATNTNSRVTGIADNMLVVDNSLRVAGIDDGVARADDRVKDVDGKMEVVDDKLVAVIVGAQYIFNQSSKFVQFLTGLADGKEARKVIQQAAGDINQVKCPWYPKRIHAGHTGLTCTGNQLRKELRRWLSPPDPSTTHNIAFNTHHRGTATWFLEGMMYREWKSTGSGSLLWIHGERVSLSHSAP